MGPGRLQSPFRAAHGEPVEPRSTRTVIRIRAHCLFRKFTPLARPLRRGDSGTETGLCNRPGDGAETP